MKSKVSKENMAIYTSQYTIACDYALIDTTGKVSVIGVFDNISVSRLPSTHPTFYIVTSIQSSVSIIQKNMKIELIRDNDNEIMLSKEFTANAELLAGESITTFNALLQVTPFIIEKSGEYRIEIGIDGSLLSTKFISVMKRNGSDITEKK